MKTLALLLLLFLVIPVNACLTEYRVVTFKPNEGKYTQEISEDFAFNLSNPYNFTITDVNLTYRSLKVKIPKLSAKDVVNLRYDLNPENFKINLRYSIEGDENEFRITFRVINQYDKPINIRLTFPKPSWLIGCENCNIVDNKIIFNKTILSEENFTLIGKGSGTFVLNDGKIKFAITEKANLSFSADIPFSIIKYKENKWYAIYEVKNDKPVAFNVTIYGYINESEPPHNLNGSKLVFTKNVTLKPNESFKFTANSTAKTPAFFIKIKPVARVICNVTVYPATKIGNHYVQYGIVEGFSFTIKPILITPITPKPQIPVGSGGGGKIIKKHVKKPIGKTPTKPPSKTPKIKPAQPISTPPTRILPKAPSKIPLIFPVVRTEAEVINSVTLGGIKINQIKADKYTIATLLPLVFFPAWMILPLVMMRTRVIFDSAVFKPEEATMFSTVLVPRDVKIGKILPANINFDDPDYELVRYIHEIYDIPLNSAKAIALAIERGYPVFLSDPYAWKVAVELGCEAYLRGW